MKIRQYKDTIIELVDNGEIGMCMSYCGAPFHEVRYSGYWKRMNSYEFEESMRYSVQGSAKEFEVADKLGITRDRNDNKDSDGYAICLSNEQRKALEERSSVLPFLIDELPCLYNAEEHPELVMTGDTSWRSTIARYSGKVADNIAYFACRERTIKAANSFWRSFSAVNKNEPRKSLKAIAGLKKSEMLINAMLLGHARAHLTQRRGVVPDGSKDLLLRVEFTSDDLPEEVKATTAALNMFEDIMPLWQEAFRSSDIAMALTAEDLANEDILTTRFEDLAEFTMMNNYMDTYLAGVPASDILA